MAKLNTQEVLELVKQGKKVYINGFEWCIKEINTILYIYCEATLSIFSPLLNEKNELILKGANYMAF
jgi:hypothetical protein